MAYPTWGTAIIQKWCALGELCTHEKAVFLLSVNILTVWLPAFLAARLTTVCLDTVSLIYAYSFPTRFIYKHLIFLMIHASKFVLYSHVVIFPISIIELMQGQYFKTPAFPITVTLAFHLSLVCHMLSLNTGKKIVIIK